MVVKFNFSPLWHTQTSVRATRAQVTLLFDWNFRACTGNALISLVGIRGKICHMSTLRKGRCHWGEGDEKVPLKNQCDMKSTAPSGDGYNILSGSRMWECIVLTTLISVDTKVCDVTEMFLKQSSPALVTLPNPSPTPNYFHGTKNSMF